MFVSKGKGVAAIMFTQVLKTIQFYWHLYFNTIRYQAYSFFYEPDIDQNFFDIAQMLEKHCIIKIQDKVAPVEWKPNINHVHTSQFYWHLYFRNSCFSSKYVYSKL